MRRLTTAPNLAMASLWSDMLTQAGMESTVLRAYASSIAGEIPPDQALPEIWILEDARLDEARRLLEALRRPPVRRWTCRCGEVIDGPFDQCWSCGTMRPLEAG
jgi:hypothetical protein